MPAPVYDHDAPMDERGLDPVVQGKCRYLVCRGCGAWVRTHGYHGERVYFGQPLVMLQVNHFHPCSALADHLKMLRKEHHGE